MDLVIYTGATDLSAAAVTSTTDLTAVADFAALTYGDSEPLSLRFTTGSAGTAPAWVGVTGHVIDVSLGFLRTDGIALCAATSAFTYSAPAYAGTLYCGSEAFASYIRSTRAGTGYLTLQIRHTDTAGKTETLAAILVPVAGSVPAAGAVTDTPVDYATWQDVLDAQTAAEAAQVAAESAQNSAESAETAAAASASLASGHKDSAAVSANAAASSANAAAASALSASTDSSTAADSAANATAAAGSATSSASSAYNNSVAAAQSAAQSAASAGAALASETAATSSAATATRGAASAVSSATSASASAATALLTAAGQFLGGVAGASVPATAANKGDYYRISAVGTSQSITWAVADMAVYNGTSGSWTRLSGLLPYATEAQALAGTDTAAALNSATGNARALQGDATRRVMDTVIYDGATTGARAYAALGTAGAVETLPIAFAGVLRNDATSAAVVRGIFCTSTTNDAYSAGSLAVYRTSNNLVVELVGTTPGTDFIRLTAANFFTTARAGAIPFTLLWNRLVAPVFYADGVAVTFAETTGGTAPAWTAAIADDFLVLGVRAATERWNNALTVTPILGTLTAAEALTYAQTGRLPPWCEQGTGSAVPTYQSNFTVNANGWAGENGGTVTADTANNELDITYGSANAARGVRYSVWGARGLRYRFSFTVTGFSGANATLKETTFGAQLSDAINANGNYARDITLTFAPSGYAISPETTGAGSLTISNFRITLLGPIAKWGIRSGRILPDMSGNRIHAVLTNGVFAITEDPNGTVMQTGLTANGELIDTTGTIPIDAVFEAFVVRNTTANAITGFSLGTTSGGAQISEATDIPANSTVVLPITLTSAATLTAGTYTALGTTFGRVYYAATTWNSGSVNISIRYRRERGI